MIPRPLRWLPFAAMLVPGLAAGASLSVGTHVGVATIFSDVEGSGHTTVWSWPENVLTYQPGLRVGLSDARHAHTLQLDSGLMNIDEGGLKLSLFALSLGYEYAFRAERPLAPTFALRGGLYREGSDVAASTSPTFGGAIGLRRRVHDDHGAVRAEAHAEYLRSSDAFGRPQLTTLGLRLGFDLWF